MFNKTYMDFNRPDTCLPSNMHDHDDNTYMYIFILKLTVIKS